MAKRSHPSRAQRLFRTSISPSCVCPVRRQRTSATGPTNRMRGGVTDLPVLAAPQRRLALLAVVRLAVAVAGFAPVPASPRAGCACAPLDGGERPDRGERQRQIICAGRHGQRTGSALAPPRPARRWHGHAFEQHDWRLAQPHLRQRRRGRRPAPASGGRGPAPAHRRPVPPLHRRRQLARVARHRRMPAGRDQRRHDQQRAQRRAMCSPPGHAAAAHAIQYPFVRATVRGRLKSFLLGRLWQSSLETAKQLAGAGRDGGQHPGTVRGGAPRQ